MALTDTEIRNVKPREKLFKMYDSLGLYVEITPKGAKRWRFKYRRPGTTKESRLSFGLYPDVSLKEARLKRDEARKLLADGIDPGQARLQEKAEKLLAAENSFQAVAEEWMAEHLATKSDSYRAKVKRLLERDVFPYIGRRPIAEIKAPEILSVVKRQQKRGVLETAHKTLQNIGQVIRYAIRTGRAENDPSLALRGALPPLNHKHMAAPTDPIEVGGYLQAFDSFKGGMVVAVAVRLLPLLFCRPGELRKMRWEEINLEAREWRYTVSKTNTDQLVPLSRQAVELLEEIQPLTIHLPGGWVFPGGRSPLNPMSEAAINAAYRRLGIDTKTELTGHGWRSIARTLLHERLKYPPEVIEHQLAHAVPDALGKTYNRTKFLDERKEMMQAWADYLDKLKAGAEVVKFPARR